MQSVEVPSYYAIGIKIHQDCEKTKVKRPLTTEELIYHRKFWSKRKPEHYRFKSDTEHLSLKKKAKCIYKCQGRIQGRYPVHLPSKCLLSEKVIFHVYLKTIHGELIS